MLHMWCGGLLIFNDNDVSHFPLYHAERDGNTNDSGVGLAVAAEGVGGQIA